MIKQKPKMILFDYGGTILCEPGWDMLRGERAVFEHVTANPHHFTPEQLSSWEKEYFQSLQSVRDLGAEPTEIQMLRLKYELHGIRLDIPYEEAECIFWDHTAPMTDKCLYPNIRKLLSFLYRSGIRTGVISNIGWTGAALQRRINTLLPDHHFEFIMASSDYGLRKPDARLFRAALEKAALKPEEVWFCGDTYDKDIDGACAAGMTAVFYQGQAGENGPRQPVQKSAERDMPVITDWAELIEILEKL
uniref:HAD superfamily hydrolase n=1 Tax=uncultured bacterium Contigcl_23 TaxID=1393667 RepID=W0FL16_9BACT|nr:HAD superfamily hydrolase [uncultured bacterium Contigcl_23]